MKYLVVGLGNIGDEYKDTRHNVGFRVLDAIAMASNISFSDKRYGMVCETRYKGRTIFLLKPSTFMNLSGNAVSYWLKKEKIPVENLCVIVDDIALPTGSIRMRSGGGDGGHNGLSHINTVLETTGYARIRIGIGNGFHKGSQVNYVLGDFSDEENKTIDEKMDLVIDMIRSFVTAGVELTMTAFNKAGKKLPPSGEQKEGNK